VEKNGYETVSDVYVCGAVSDADKSPQLVRLCRHVIFQASFTGVSVRYSEARAIAAVISRTDISPSKH